MDNYGGLEKVTIVRKSDHTADVMIGPYKLLEIVYNDRGKHRKRAIHKRKREEPIVVDASELCDALKKALQ